MNSNEPPFRIAWENNRWYHSNDGIIGRPVEKLFGTYPPLFFKRESNDETVIQEKARQIARGYEGTFFFYDPESCGQRISLQLATPTITGYDLSQGDHLEPVSYPFEIITNEQFPTRKKLLDDVIKEAKRRSLLEIMDNFRTGDFLRFEERSIVPVQLYRRR